MEKEIVKEYSNGEVTVVWTPHTCIHSGICLKSLPGVFNLKSKPWVNMEGASSEEIVKAVRKCPSKALSIKGVRFKEPDYSDREIELIPHGPIIVKGGGKVMNRGSEKVFNETVAFCRCGRSQQHPYCDGTHAKKK